jgi:hypothetical protein
MAPGAAGKGPAGQREYRAHENISAGFCFQQTERASVAAAQTKWLHGRVAVLSAVLPWVAP